MKLLFLSLTILLISFSVSGQNTNEKSKAQKDDNPPLYEGWKDGNNTFKLNIKTLQSYFIKPYTVKQFEKTLGQYERRWYESDTTFYLNDTTYERNGKYQVKIPYAIMNKDLTVYFIYVYYGKDEIIKSINYTLEEDEIRVEKFKQFLKQLTVEGYKTDLVYTRINNKLAGNKRRYYFYHPKTKVSIGIYLIEEDRYSITFSKS